MKRKHILGISLILLIAWFTYTPAAVNFPHNLLTLFLGEDHTWTGTNTHTGQNIFTGGSASSPSVALDDDGNTGAYSDSPDVFSFATGGARQGFITSAQITTANGSGGAIQNEATSAINPTLLPNRSTLGTGVGSPADGKVSIIGDDLEILRADGTASSGASVFVLGGMVIGSAVAITDPAATGITSFLTIMSGASPAGSMSGVSDASTLYVFAGQMYVNDTDGTHTTIGSFNRETGQATSKKWNDYTGKIVTKNWETGEVSISYGTKRDWKADQVVAQKRSFINSYTQQSVEVPEGQATDFPDVEVDDGTRTKEWKFEKGKKVEYWVKGKKTKKGKIKTIKPGHWMDEDGKFWRKHTRAEAIAAYSEDMAPIRAKWLTLAPFLKAEIDDPGE